MKVVRLLALVAGRLYPQDMPVVLVSVRGRVDPRAIERAVGLSNRKTRIESTNFWLVATVPPRTTCQTHITPKLYLLISLAVY